MSGSEPSSKWDPTSVRWAVLGAVLFLLVGAATLVFRHFYDDEVTNLNVITGRSLAQVWEVMNRNDVHPPLAYSLNWLTWKAFGSHEAILIGPLLLNALAVWYFLAHAVKRSKSGISTQLLVAWTALSPTLLTWGVSIRWYGYWTPLALALITLLHLAPRDRSTVWKALALAVLMFYLSYLTLVFLAALLAVELWTRRGRLGGRALIAAVAWALLVAPQMAVFLKVHLPESRSQTTRSLTKILTSTVTGTVVGPTTMPTDLWTVPMILVAAIVACVVLYRYFRKIDGRDAPHVPLIAPLLAYLVLLAASGLMAKDRNVLVLSVLFFGCVTLALPRLNVWLQRAFVVVSMVFLVVSTRNIVLKEGTVKGSINLPVARVLDELRKGAGSDTPEKVTVFTYDPVLNYYCRREGYRTISPPVLMRTDRAADPLSATSFAPPGRAAVLATGQGVYDDGQFGLIRDAMKSIDDRLHDKRSVDIGRDPTAKLKAKLSGQAFPEYYVTLTDGRLLTGTVVDLSGLEDWGSREKS